MSGVKMALHLSGPIYPQFTQDAQRYTTEDKRCVERVVERLLAVQTSAARPGMLLGKIQSGKTKTFLAAIALAFDNKFDIAVILTKGTKALARQTLERVRREFAPFHSQDTMQIFDIMTVPSGLTGYELNQKLIFVSKKQSDNLDRLSALFRDTYPELAKKRVLIIDDEADYASVGFRNTKNEGIIINTTAHQIDELRQIIPGSAFLQVTATPYSLYLQPQDLVVNGVEFHPIRPAFTELVPVSPQYVGSDYYFADPSGSDSQRSFLYTPVTVAELRVLHGPDRRRFKIEECLTSDAISALRSAICNFVVGGCIRRLQDQRAGVALKKFSFLVHTASQRAAHAWQEQVVITLNEKLTEAATKDPKRLRALITASYNDLSQSIRTMEHYLPPLEAVIDAAVNALKEGWLMITKVNSEQQVEDLLDSEGQLRLRTPLNIFIGGQILDRGVTIANLIGFFYGRRPHIYQQDTVLQHSRMFGFRPVQDLAVTRFYTEPQIYQAMKRMHESDVALRESIQNSPDQPVVFIQRDSRGQVIPCSPNKILLSNTTALRPFKRILPVGFQTESPARLRAAVREIDRALDELSPGGFDEPFEIPLSTATNLLSQIQPTLVMEVDEGFDFDWDAARAALAYLSNASENPTNKGHVLCLVRKDRNISRLLSVGSHGIYADAPDTTRTEGAVARRVAIDMPMLMLIRQNGREEQGWRGAPFYWPVIVAQQRLRTAIFAHETLP